MLVPEEINLLVTSDSTQGARNVSRDGSRFTCKIRRSN